MTVRVITPPTEIVTLDEARRHLIDVASEDEALVESFILAATAWLDGPAGWLGRALGVQVLEWSGSSWPCWPDFHLPFPPTIEVISITYVDPAGDEQTMPVPDPFYLENMPALRGRDGDLKIRYRAGYGTKDNADPPVWTNSAPAPIKVAILMLVTQWYRNRGSVAVGATVEELPFAVEALLSPYRVFRSYHGSY